MHPEALCTLPFPGKGGVTVKTRILKVDPRRPEPEPIRAAAEVLRGGGLVAFPTETVYGLGANALDPEAVAAIFRAKGRPADNPLIVHVADRQWVQELVKVLPDQAQVLIDRFWPGPLTVALPKQPHIPDIVTGGLSTVGVRMPAHPVALALIKAAGVPIAAPSANLSGRPSPTTAEDVWEDLNGRVDLILDGGETGVGLESTFLDLSTDPPVLCRPGGINPSDICSVIGPIQIDPSVYANLEEHEMPRSPGQKYTHYAPKAEVLVVEGALETVHAKINSLAYEYMQEGRRVGVLATAESRGVYQVPVVLEIGSRKNLPMIASALFSTLRAFDRHGVEVVLAESLPEEGIGLAVMNRLRKAAGGRVIRV